ncbi:hypothetical protein ACNVED_10720 [Legionella sp. D16C41]|uniref:hypothetical protein n=1 Tax=Legionella sp. D16C41 TaxID=3402688 RepID=UPI003AF8E327
MKATWKIVESVINQYYSLGFKRNKVLFTEFLPKGYTKVTLDTVLPAYWQDLINIKILLGIFITLYDDFVDNPNYVNPKLINELVKLPLTSPTIDKSNLTEFELTVLAFAENIFTQIIAFLRSLPNFILLKPLFYFDVEQFFNGLKYAQLIRHVPLMANEVEYLCYLPHNMGIIIAGMMDLMAVAYLDMKELGLMREFF